ncbi:MAG: HemK2/MTQ2 family protein methyltransferase [Candidatus Buchananbacteria bacterium]
MIKKIKPSQFKAKTSQAKYFEERQNAKTIEKNSCGFDIKIFKTVYKASTDTELMAQTVKILPSQTFLEIGCGCGVISIMLAQKAKSGMGVDINKMAVKNSQANAKRYQIKNLKFLQSDLFEKVKGKFNVIVCNPPYSPYQAKNDTGKMFWDFNNKMKKRFFAEVGDYLNKNGTIFFGWADFADIDLNLPFELTKKYGFKIVEIKKKKSNHRNYNLFVFKIIKK